MSRTTSVILLVPVLVILWLGAVITGQQSAHARDSSRAAYAMQRLLTAEVPVGSQSNNERIRAVRAAFAEVLVRVSGHASVLQISPVRSELARANDYVIQFSYTSQQGQTFLQVTFNEERIVALLRDSGASVWSARRPQIMVWLAGQGLNGIELIGRDSGHAIVAPIMQQAQLRGLDLSYPLLDLTDRLALNGSDVWGRFEQPVTAATQRYGANGIVMVRLLEAEHTDPVAEWSLVIGNLSTQGFTQHADITQLGMQLANDIVEAVASAYAVSFAETEQAEVFLRLLNAHNLEHVLAAEQLLGRLSPVKRIIMTRYHQGTAEFSLVVVGNKERLAHSLELERRLQRIEDPWSRTESTVLEYRWLR
ncbi:DUF2066 domain-containing protein [Aliidiomarina quisquiliarum]|uniref:DUF2066 domain-containing protein n=1 Tax=Aliidiomarina quisquiliarum TaxID=2938947 RepID=UPI00208E4EE2|nr:DUF2066 domain-containing protein [Aliidiomarina quisquiliarum]